MTTETTTRFLGNCQLCEGDFKLADGRMVHHGYRRPGHGQIEGDCPGVHAEPYEVSCEQIKSHLKATERGIEEMSKTLAKYEAGEVTHFTKTSYKTSFGRLVGITTVDYSIGVTEYYTWKTEFDARKREIAYTIRQEQARADRYSKRIAAWTLKPIRTVEELVAEEKAAKDVRAAERAAARQARADKAAATKAKQDALKAKRQAIMDDFRTKFIALAESPESLESRKTEALKLAQEMAKKKYSFFYARELKCDDAFITLGLASRDKTNWVSYRV